MKEEMKPEDIALLKAAKEGRLDDVIGHLAGGADVGARDEDRRTPFMLAAMGGHEQVARILLISGADIQATDKNKRTAVKLAIQEGQRTMAKWILDGLADKMAEYTSHFTAAMIQEQSEGSGPAHFLRNLINNPPPTSAEGFDMAGPFTEDGADKMAITGGFPIFEEREGEDPAATDKSARPEGEDKKTPQEKTER